MERENNNIEKSRKKLSKEIEKTRELEQELADIRFKIASIKKRIGIKKRTFPFKSAGGEVSSSRGTIRPEVGASSSSGEESRRRRRDEVVEEGVGDAERRRRTRRRVEREDEGVTSRAEEADHDEIELERLMSSEAELAKKLEIASEKVESNVEDFATFDISESARLLSSDLPILLFPVRLETKFVDVDDDSQGVKQLLVRIYPDDKIAVQTHENRLTEDEKESGEIYWKTVWYKGQSNIDARKKAWGTLVLRYGAARAAWIVRVLEEHLQNKDQWPADESDEGRVPKPSFKPIELKPISWTMPPSTRIMPDRWVVITYIGNQETHRVVGNPIPPNLNVAIDPMSQKEEDIGGEGELKVDEGIKWTVDFATAESKGMGIRINNLTPAEQEGGFSRIIVIGLKYSADENESTNLVKDLFESHHYTRGLAFVPQGTPTNNTADKKSGFSSRDDDANYQNSFEVEIADTPLYNPENDLYKAKDGEIAAIALGLIPDFFVHIKNSGLSEHQDARHMGIALWPLAGYFLEQMMRPPLGMGPPLDTEDIVSLRRFFIDNVRARGPYSAIRVGKSPYGILPASSLKRWQSIEQEDGKIELFLPSFIKKLYTQWEKPVLDRKVAYVGRLTRDPDSDLLGILGMDPSSLEFYARILFGSQFLIHYFELNLGRHRDPEEWWETHARIARSFLNILGYTDDVQPQITSMTYTTAYKVLLDTVYKPPLSEKESLPETSNYVSWLSTAILDEIKNRIKFKDDLPNTLLYILLRYSILRQYVSISVRILRQRNLIPENETYEPELVNEVIGGGGGGEGDDGRRIFTATHTVFSALGKFVPDDLSPLTPDQTLEQYLDGIRSTENTLADENLRELAELREGLVHLKDVPTAKLERLMSETLDLFSHRLDAWITGLYTARLNKMRKRTRTTKKGIYIGGYGWIENLHPSPSNLKQLAEEVAGGLPDYTRSAITEPAREDRILPKPVVSRTNAGFIHAPSLSQAAAAAVLRNASLTHRAGGEDQFQINLSSERVKRSLWFLEGIRQGQPLAALLGYRFERGLHENHQGLELDQYIQPLRDLFPLNPREMQSQPATTTNPQEKIQARDVVNGLEMMKTWREGNFPFKNKKLGLDPPDSNAKKLEKLAIMDELQALDNIIDSISDLTLAESVFQMVQGNYTASAANLDAHSRGDRPPEPAIVKTPRSGITLTHRVMLVLFENHPDLPNFWDSSKNNPRAKAEPDLNSWLAKLLGNPSKIVCKVKYKITSSHDASSTPTPSPSSSEAAIKTKYVTLEDLELCPLDFLELSITSDEHQQSEIDARFAHFILSDNPDRKILEKVYAVSSAELENDQISFTDALEFARKLRQFISSSRKLMPEHLLLPEEEVLKEADSKAIAREVEQELVDRVRKAEDDLRSTIELLTTASNQKALVRALRKASLFGVLGAFPDPQNGKSEKDYLECLKGRAEITKTELQKRLVRSEELQYELDDYASKIKTASAKINEIFGSSFVILPKFTLPTSKSAELNNSLGNSQRLLDGDEDTPLPWFQQAAKVRHLLCHYEDAMAFSEALKRDIILEFKVAQIPFNSSDRWIALPFDKNNEKEKPINGKLSFVISPYGTADFAAGKICGLVIDDWEEVIPDDKETTGIAFHYDGPSSEAPQALLLAIPPGNRPTWELDDVVAVVNETLDLVKVRAVDLDIFAEAAHFLPALYFTSSATAINYKKQKIIDADLEGNNILKRSTTRGGP